MGESGDAYYWQCRFFGLVYARVRLTTTLTTILSKLPKRIL
jgi:hypothetical protein